ncbi:MAG TPA: glycosyltransferase family 87 protein [Tepidisphaeraceae bacterium]|jgi:hypothetical protein|nr:glycosyltransferase family 87 protein [Tepidisphaeraceae bacterium]
MNGGSSPRVSLPSSVLRWIAIGGLAAIFGYFLIYHLLHQTKGDRSRLGDFPTFYIAAQYAVAHKDIYTAGTSPAMMYVYPPLIAFVYSPLTLVSERHAAQVSLVLNTLMLFGSVKLGARAILRRLDAHTPDREWAVAFLASLFGLNEMRAVLTMGETDAIMLFMFVLALYWLDRLPALAGMALALALNIKYLPIVALPWLILRRRWAALAWTAIGTAFFALFPAVLLGWHEDLRCLRVALAGLLKWVGVAPEVSHGIKVHNIGDGLSVSITSVLARVLGPHGFSNAAVMALAAVVGLLALAVVAGMYRANRFPLLSWPAAWRQGDQPFKGLVALEWAGLVTVALTFSPDTNTRHLVIATLVNTLAAALLVTPRPGVRRGPAVAGVLLIFLSFIMPGARAWKAAHFFYFNYSVPGWGLLGGYLLILWAGLKSVAAISNASHPEEIGDLRRSRTYGRPSSAL